ncbi:hypothetical protein [Pedobacter aquatilis]|uniref:hypothetical protein n=1 Tax=Pedobacter aquatilis TaxID=351343 RepID=UPI0029314151|nr:hypothetical protein [Pedobacter aquatilis]
MKKVVLVITAIFAIIGSAKSQNMYGETLSGVPLKIKIYENVNGTPYLNEEWTKGTVVLENGTKSGSLDLKFDLVAQELIFKDASGNPLNFANRVKEFVLQSSGNNQQLYRRNFPKTEDSTPDDFFQVISDKNVKLLKRTKKFIIDTKQYASSTVDRSIEERTAYYILSGNTLIKVSNAKNLQKAFPKVSAELETYLSKNKLNTKNEADLILIANYLDQLTTGRN